MAKKSKTERLINYLDEHRSITSYEAFKYLNITRLSGHIFYLKSKGFIFTTVMETHPETDSRFARYTLEYNPDETEI